MANTLEVLNSANIAYLLNKPVFQAQQAAPQSIPTGFGGTSIIYTTPVIDSYGGWSGGTPTRYTGKVAGYYLVIGQLSFATNTTGNRVAQVLKNSSTATTYGSMGVPTCNTASFNTNLNTTGMVFLNGTTDYVELVGYQDSGGALSTVVSGTFLTLLHIHQ